MPKWVNRMLRNYFQLGPFVIRLGKILNLMSNYSIGWYSIQSLYILTTTFNMNFLINSMSYRKSVFIWTSVFIKGGIFLYFF